MTVNSPTPATEEELAQSRAREARLRARIDELEAELGRSGRQGRMPEARQARETVDSISDTATRLTDETGKLVRGVAWSSLEVVRGFADALTTFVDGVYDRNSPDEGESVLDLARTLPGDITAGFFDGVNRALDVPNRSVDTLQNTYRETEQTRRRQRRSRRYGTEETAQDVQNEQVRRLQEEEEAIRKALGRPVTRVILDASDNVILNVGDIITNAAIRRARQAGVLDILLDSVWEKEPFINTSEARAPEAGQASLEAQHRSSEGQRSSKKAEGTNQ